MQIPVVYAPPVEEPVLLGELMAYLDLDDDSEKVMLQGLVSAARIQAELITRRQLVTATYDVSFEDFPFNAMRGRGLPDAGILRLPKPPLQSVTSIKYIDSAGVQQTLSSALYQVDIASEPGRVLPVYGQYWPVTRRQMNAVTVRPESIA